MCCPSNGELPSMCYRFLFPKRGDIITSHYLESGVMYSPKEVAQMEKFYLPYLKVRPMDKSKGKSKQISIFMGLPLHKTLSSATSATESKEYLELFRNHKYVLGICHYVFFVAVP